MPEFSAEPQKAYSYAGMLVLSGLGWLPAIQVRLP